MFYSKRKICMKELELTTFFARNVSSTMSGDQSLAALAFSPQTRIVRSKVLSRYSFILPVDKTVSSQKAVKM